MQVFAETASVEGEWYLNSLVMEGAELSPAALGLEMVIALETGGTARIQVSGEEDETATWALEGETITVTSGEEVIVFTIEGDTLTVADDEGVMVFGKEKVEAEAFVASPVREDALLSDFDGAWTATIIDMMGMQLPVGSLGMDMTLTIANGAATIVSLSEEGEQSDEVNGDFAGHSLTLVIPSTEIAGETTMVLVLHEDGAMSFSDEDATVYFEKP